MFLDDNPLEREWVRSQLPDVTVVDPGPNVFHYLRNLDPRPLFLFRSRSSPEDLARSAQYRTPRPRVKPCAPPLVPWTIFWSNCSWKLRLSPSVRTNLPRVNPADQQDQPIQRHHSNASPKPQVWHAAQDPLTWTSAFQMADRFGSYGLIGVILCRTRDDLRAWEIDLWLMSCRTLGRQMEKFMFDPVD